MPRVEATEEPRGSAASQRSNQSRQSPRTAPRDDGTHLPALKFLLIHKKHTRRHECLQKLDLCLTKSAEDEAALMKLQIKN